MVIPLLAVVAACSTPFAQTFPSPRRSPRPMVMMPAPAPAAQVPPAYAASPSPPPAYGGPAYYAPQQVPAPMAPGEPAAGSTTWNRPIPTPPGAAAPAGRCENTCDLANDGECDDGRAGSGSDLCMPGTDCADCGA